MMAAAVANVDDVVWPMDFLFEGCVTVTQSGLAVGFAHVTCCNQHVYTCNIALNLDHVCFKETQYD